MQQIVVRSDASLDKFKALANLLDSAFHVPGTRIRIGVDALLGLIPVVGDVLSAMLGAYIVRSAAGFGVPRIVQTRMMLNLWIDTVIGAIPFVGDLFDIGWKANIRNVALMEQAMTDPDAARRSSYRVMFGLAVISAVLLSAIIVLILWLTGTIRFQ